MYESIRLVLVDGLPGSGKTTLSRQLATTYSSPGADCGWVREEDEAHPFFGPEVRSLHRRSDYDEACIERWRLLPAVATDTPWILDACALQSTVRFMFEQLWTMERIDNYWHRFEAIVAPIGAAHVHMHARAHHLTQSDPEAFIRDHTMKVRAAVWSKIAAHVEATPAGIALANAGLDAPVEFWVRYRQLCDALLARSTLPVLAIDVTNGWAGAAQEVQRWIVKVGREPSGSSRHFRHPRGGIRRGAARAGWRVSPSRRRHW